jgi:hypothetical protein
MSFQRKKLENQKRKFMLKNKYLPFSKAFTVSFSHKLLPLFPEFYVLSSSSNEKMRKLQKKIYAEKH